MALQNLRSSTPSKRPDASSMSDGQIALNTAAASAGLFFKDSNGDLVKTGPVHIGATAPNSSPATGGSTGNSKGEAWLDTTNGNYVLKIYDGTAFQSVEMAAGSARQLLQTNAAGTDVEFTSNVDVPGTLDVTGATTLDSTASVAGLLSANGKISFDAGNAAAPGIHPGSDTDTGIYSPSANTVAVSTQGTERVKVTADGKTNLGGSAGLVGSKFNIFNGSDNQNVLGITGADESSEYAGIGVHGGNAVITGGGIGSTNTGIVFRSAQGGTEVERLRIGASGAIGVGTSNPTQPLDVVGNIAVSGTVDGRDLAADGAKLDGIQAGATAGSGYSTPTEVLNAIKTVDGSGSGLDADLLDGQNLSSDSTANTVVGRTANSDINVRLVRQTFQNQSTISGGMVFRINESSDNYLRVCNSTSAIRTFLGVTATGADTNYLSATGNDSAAGTITFNGAVNIRSALDFADGDVLRMGNSDDFTVTFNSNSWNYINQKGNGIIFQDSGSNVVRLEDSGDFRPENDHSKQLGLSNKRWNYGYFRYLRGSSVATPGFNNTSIGYSFDNGGVGYISRTGGTPLHLNRSNNGTILQFRRNNVEHGRVLINTNAAPGVSYSTNSDYRLKENVVVLDNAIDRVKQLLPKRFNFIGNGVVLDGFLAHEAQTVVPEAIDGTKDAMQDIGTLAEWDGTVLETNVTKPPANELSWEEEVTDENGNQTVETRTRTWTQTGNEPVYQGIDQAKLVPLLTAALQEAISKIETLETKVAALEAG